MGTIVGIIQVLLAIVKGLFGTKKPVKTTVTTPEPEVEVTDGKTVEERRHDLGY